MVSYSPYSSATEARPRVMTVDQIAELAKQHYPFVDIRSAGEVFHSRLNKTELNKEIDYEAETLIVCRFS